MKRWAFAGVLLGDQQMIDLVKTADDDTFGENDGVAVGANAGVALFAQVECSEQMYWKKLADHEASGAKTCADPYGYIDGGQEPGESYLGCCLAKNWQYASLAARLLPALRPVWNDEPFHQFVDRYAESGSWTQPDPCAPPDSAACCEGPPHDNHGVTFGPDGQGGCIADTNPGDGVGRAPQTHGQNVNFGYHGDAFGDAMWQAYKDQIPAVCQGDGDCVGDEKCCGGSCALPVCDDDGDCDDQNPITADRCSAPGTCGARCENAAAADGGVDAAADDGGAGDGGPAGDAVEDDGCSCRAGGGGAPQLAWALLLLAWLRRRGARSLRRP